MRMNVRVSKIVEEKKRAGVEEFWSSKSILSDKFPRHSRSKKSRVMFEGQRENR